ncbi:MAG: AraC family transcriptional regulator [Acidobacteriota bacterium]
MKLPSGHLYGETSIQYEVADFRLMNATYAPRLRLPKHSHTRACFSVMLHGTLSENYGRRSLEWRPFSVGFNSPDEEHSNFIHDAGARFFIVEVSPAWLQHISEYSKTLKQSFVYQGGPLRYLGLRLFREAAQIDAVSQLAIEGLLLEVVAETSRLDTGSKVDEHPRWLKQACELIDAHFTEPLTVTTIARHIGIHPVHLARVFRRHQRCTIAEYVRQLRLEFVCRELSASDTSLADIAANAGYCDQGHLSKVFKRYTGMTLNQYRISSRSR